MAHRYRIDPSFNLLIDKFEGKMRWQSVLGGILSSNEDPEFQQGMNVVADLTAADLELGYEEIDTLTFAISVVPTAKYGRIAVVTEGSFQFEIARIFGTFADELNIYAEYRVFSNFLEARTWLGLPENVGLRL